MLTSSFFPVTAASARCVDPVHVYGCYLGSHSTICCWMYRRIWPRWWWPAFPYRTWNLFGGGLKTWRLWPSEENFSCDVGRVGFAFRGFGCRAGCPWSLAARSCWIHPWNDSKGRCSRWRWEDCTTIGKETTAFWERECRLIDQMQIIRWTARRVWISWTGLPWNTWSCTKTRLRNRSCPVHDHRRRDDTTDTTAASVNSQRLTKKELVRRKKAACWRKFFKCRSRSQQFSCIFILLTHALSVRVCSTPWTTIEVDENLKLVSRVLLAELPEEWSDSACWLVDEKMANSWSTVQV